ncbi:Aspartyl protease [Carpediemonas membranifera]|uniref:Aspartyl protease n=1 Tax=Carpediemonas membranifera TaxID=201153 RepID=A0A8J6AUU5_9EUKA|nr:Aspartyl protease [Carpediemonas membranifera]|eukprot:KAG9395326.1 Aspartyl protease [Carpediemonas membranifera]
MKPLLPNSDDLSVWNGFVESLQHYLQAEDVLCPVASLFTPAHHDFFTTLLRSKEAAYLPLDGSDARKFRTHTDLLTFLSTEAEPYTLKKPKPDQDPLEEGKKRMDQLEEGIRLLKARTDEASVETCAEAEAELEELKAARGMLLIKPYKPVFPHGTRAQQKAALVEQARRLRDLVGRTLSATPAEQLQVALRQLSRKPKGHEHFSIDNAAVYLAEVQQTLRDYNYTALLAETGDDAAPAVSEEINAAVIKIILTHMNAPPLALTRLFGEGATTYFDGSLCLDDLMSRATALVAKLRSYRDEIREFEGHAAQSARSTQHNDTEGDARRAPPAKVPAETSAQVDRETKDAKPKKAPRQVCAFHPAAKDHSTNSCPDLVKGIDKLSDAQIVAHARECKTHYPAWKPMREVRAEAERRKIDLSRTADVAADRTRQKALFLAEEAVRTRFAPVDLRVD